MALVGLCAWDDVNKEWVKVKTDDQGRLYTVAVIDELDDIGDVYVPSPTDLYILYWDNGNSRWACRAISDWSVVMKSLFDAYSILYADTDNTPAALAIAASRLIGRKSTGGITTLAAADIFTLLGITASAAELNVLDGIPGTLTATELGYVDGVTSAIQAQIDAKIAKATLDAYSILAADTDNIPMAVALAVSQLIGRKSSGGIVALSKADILTIINVADGADVTGSNPPQAHKDLHDPNDGSDALDTAAPVKIGEANAIGTSHSLARADHVHEKHHSAVVSLTFIIDGGGSAITTGEKGHLEIPFAGTITQVTMLGDQSGSIVVDIWKDSYANFPPTDADSITASAVPTITTAQKSQDSTLTGWTTAIAAGDILAFNVDSCTDITRVTISLKVTKS